MTKQEQIRRQLQIGLPEVWITDTLVEAVIFALGNGFVNACPELCEPRHVVAITRYARKIEEASE